MTKSRKAGFRIEPLGDAAALIECGDEDAAAALAHAIRAARPPWLIDVVLAYNSVAICFDLLATNFAEASAWLAALSPLLGDGRRGILRLRRRKTLDEDQEARLHLIPCLYDGADLDVAAATLELSPTELIRLHAAQRYRVFAIGFSPGFPYLGYLPEPLRGLPRLASPRKRVDAGSVAIVGQQCCVYPSATPGGWQLIGRTPRKLVDLEEEYFPLRPGDFVQFVPIEDSDFAAQQGLRLDPPVPFDPKKGLLVSA